MKKDKITRLELYDLVWSLTITELTKKLEISNHYLRKICKELSVPMPKVGYWQKIKYGKPVRKIKLPLDYSGENEIFLISEKRQRDKRINGLQDYIQDLKGTKGLPLKVPGRLTNPDKLIIDASNEITERIKLYNYNDSTVNSGTGNIHIDVSPKNVKRALRFMDTLIKLLHARNHDIRINGWTTEAIVYGQKINIKLNEKHKRIKLENGWNTTIPTGTLTFRYGESYQIKVISDGKIKIEDQLPKILALLEIKGKKEKKRREEIEKYWEKMRIEEEEEKAIIERKKQEIELIKKLFKIAQRRHQANFVRQYLHTLENNAKSKGTLDDELKNWIEWANDKVDWYDPFVNKEDDILVGLTPEDILDNDSPNKENHNYSTSNSMQNDRNWRGFKW